MIVKKLVPHSYLVDDYNSFVTRKEAIEVELDAEKELAIEEIVAKYEMLKTQKTAVYERLIAECLTEVEEEIPDEPEIALVSEETEQVEEQVETVSNIVVGVSVGV